MKTERDSDITVKQDERGVVQIETLEVELTEENFDSVATAKRELKKRETLFTLEGVLGTCGAVFFGGYGVSHVLSGIQNRNSDQLLTGILSIGTATAILGVSLDRFRRAIITAGQTNELNITFKE